ncbi:aminoacyl-tRNA hydrolase [Candidatus Microgenomates bacterium]|nr:MAG: aminoacyl-tRNA hydrolase [Candidatus Microgenomates bacterium]
MRLIVGLGNFGEKHEKTRHNLGFRVLDKLASSVERLASSWKREERFKSEIGKLTGDILVAKPLTYMNNSGLAVSLISNFYKIKPEDVWIIHDDIDLDMGHIKIRLGGGSAGHKGVESIMETLGTDKFWRFRLGIGKHVERLEGDKKLKKEKLKNVEDYVLGEFTKDESGRVNDLIGRGAKAIEFAIKNGLEKAMNKFNAK